MEMLEVMRDVTPAWLETYHVLFASPKFTNKYFSEEAEKFKKLSIQYRQVCQVFQAKMDSTLVTAAQEYLPHIDKLYKVKEKME